MQAEQAPCILGLARKTVTPTIMRRREYYKHAIKWLLGRSNKNEEENNNPGLLRPMSAYIPAKSMGWPIKVK